MASKSFEECLSIVNNLVPRKLKNNISFSTLLRILAYSMQKNYDELDRVDGAYDIDTMDEREIPRLADTIGIVFPIDKSVDTLKLILKYYGKIIKDRGSLASIKQMIRIIESTEEDLYNMSLDDYSDVTVSLIEPGFMMIRHDGTIDIEYAYSMLRKVVPAGYRYEIANRSGPIVKGFDSGYVEETYSIEPIYGDVILFDEIATIEEL